MRLQNSSDMQSTQKIFRTKELIFNSTELFFGLTKNELNFFSGLNAIFYFGWRDTTHIKHNGMTREKLHMNL